MQKKMTQTSNERRSARENFFPEIFDPSALKNNHKAPSPSPLFMTPSPHSFVTSSSASDLTIFEDESLECIDLNSRATPKTHAASPSFHAWREDASPRASTLLPPIKKELRASRFALTESPVKNLPPSPLLERGAVEDDLDFEWTASPRAK